jgi:hypothetical protein
MINPKRSTLRLSEERGLVESPHIMQKGWDDEEFPTRRQILL